MRIVLENVRMFIYQLLRLTRWLPLNAVQLDPITSISRVISLDDKSVFAHYFSLAFLSWKLSLWIFRRIQMCVFSTSYTKIELDRFTNNGDLLSDRNHWKHRQTDRQTHTDTESDIEWMNEVVTCIPPFIRSVNQSQSGSQYKPQTIWWAAYLGRTV